MEEELRESTDSLIDILHKVHCDNSKQQYYAERPGHRVSTMPLTPFVFEFFLFNSLYQVDWNKSHEKRELIYHSDDCSESKKQREFIKYVKNHAKEHPSDFYRAFEPLVLLPVVPVVKGAWTDVTPDARISKECGSSFFSKVKLLQQEIESCRNPDEMPTSREVFKLIKAGTYFINNVRNNIFHGSKTLGEVWDPNQKRRIEVYELFLKGVTSLFFLAAGKTPVASDYIPCSISSNSLPLSQDQEILDQNAIWTAINKKIMKIGDSRLVSQFTKRVVPTTTTPSNKSALFYPSSDTDILTPLLLGLPYCTQFYFYERSRDLQLPSIKNILKLIPTVKLGDQLGGSGWSHQDNAHRFEFEYGGIPRIIHWVHSDNMEFLKRDVELAFYFHRGDSQGEGGSGQEWDSKLLPKLATKVPPDKRCIFLSDGEPGGFDNEYLESCEKLCTPFIERERTYYYGYLAKRNECLP